MSVLSSLAQSARNFEWSSRSVGQVVGKVCVAATVATVAFKAIWALGSWIASFFRDPPPPINRDRDITRVANPDLADTTLAVIPRLPPRLPHGGRHLAPAPDDAQPIVASTAARRRSTPVIRLLTVTVPFVRMTVSFPVVTYTHGNRTTYTVPQEVIRNFPRLVALFRRQQQPPSTYRIEELPPHAPVASRDSRVRPPSLPGFTGSHWPARLLAQSPFHDANDLRRSLALTSTEHPCRHLPSTLTLNLHTLLPIEEEDPTTLAWPEWRTSYILDLSATGSNLVTTRRRRRRPRQPSRYETVLAEAKRVDSLANENNRAAREERLQLECRSRNGTTDVSSLRRRFEVAAAPAPAPRARRRSPTAADVTPHHVPLSRIDTIRRAAIPAGAGHPTALRRSHDVASLAANGQSSSPDAPRSEVSQPDLNKSAANLAVIAAHGSISEIPIPDSDMDIDLEPTPTILDLMSLRGIARIWSLYSRIATRMLQLQERTSLNQTILQHRLEPKLQTQAPASMQYLLNLLTFGNPLAKACCSKRGSLTTRAKVVMETQRRVARGTCVRWTAKIVGAVCWPIINCQRITRDPIVARLTKESKRVFDVATYIPKRIALKKSLMRAQRKLHNELKTHASNPLAKKAINLALQRNQHFLQGLDSCQSIADFQLLCSHMAAHNVLNTTLNTLKMYLFSSACEILCIHLDLKNSESINSAAQQLERLSHERAKTLTMQQKSALGYYHIAEECRKFQENPNLSLHKSSSLEDIGLNLLGMYIKFNDATTPEKLDLFRKNASGFLISEILTPLCSWAATKAYEAAASKYAVGPAFDGATLWFTATYVAPIAGAWMATAEQAASVTTTVATASSYTAKAASAASIAYVVIPPTAAIASLLGDIGQSEADATTIMQALHESKMGSFLSTGEQMMATRYGISLQQVRRTVSTMLMIASGSMKMIHPNGGVLLPKKALIRQIDRKMTPILLSINISRLGSRMFTPRATTTPSGYPDPGPRPIEPKKPHLKTGIMDFSGFAARELPTAEKEYEEQHAKWQEHDRLWKECKDRYDSVAPGEPPIKPTMPVRRNWYGTRALNTEHDRQAYRARNAIFKSESAAYEARKTNWNKLIEADQKKAKQDRLEAKSADIIKRAVWRVISKKNTEAQAALKMIDVDHKRYNHLQQSSTVLQQRAMLAIFQASMLLLMGYFIINRIFNDSEEA
ncbi:MAG: hypothetical protein P0S95_05030 [Rhabdochlamydiaceae bacterium]|nr:hypothetical protein [Candidatus Amphrikana amoebophyrae]